MITYNQQGIIKYDIKHVIFLFRVHIMKKITVSNVVSLFYFLDAGRPDLYLLYFIYFLCIYVKTFYVFHLCLPFMGFTHICVLVTCTYKYICVSLYSVYVFMCVCF